MYLTADGSRRSLTLAVASPATLLPLVLLLEPLLQWLEVLEQRAAVHLALPGHRFEGVRPRLARSHREHFPETLSRFLAAVEGALVQGPLLSGRLAHGAVELELEESGEEVARIGHVRGHVVLGAGIEVLLRPRHRRRYPLVLRPQSPPGLVVVGGRRLSAEHVPTPLIDQLREGQESHLGEGVLHLEVDHGFLVVRYRRNQAELLEVSGGHREHQRVSDRLVETVVRASLVEQG